MLQNLKPSAKREKEWKMWNKVLDKEYPEYRKHNVLGFNRFIPYSPNGKEYSADFLDCSTGVYIMKSGYGGIAPFHDITWCTRSRSDGKSIVYGLCDNASQVVDLYNALFNNEEYHGDSDVLNYWVRVRERYRNKLQEHPDNKRIKSANKYWTGNHVIILRRHNDLRWHKWGIYVGDATHKCEYLSEEECIHQVYSFDIYKVC